MLFSAAFAQIRCQRGKKKELDPRRQKLGCCENVSKSCEYAFQNEFSLENLTFKKRSQGIATGLERCLEKPASDSGRPQKRTVPVAVIAEKIEQHRLVDGQGYRTEYLSCATDKSFGLINGPTGRNQTVVSPFRYASLITVHIILDPPASACPSDPLTTFVRLVRLLTTMAFPTIPCET